MKDSKDQLYNKLLKNNKEKWNKKRDFKKKSSHSKEDILLIY